MTPASNALPRQLAPPTPAGSRLWDVFCRVIDNHGDLGVLWRLSCQLAERGHRVRLWVDDARALAWMAPGSQPGVSVYPWADSTHVPTLRHLPMADVWVEGFGCEIEPTFIAHYLNNESGRGQFGFNMPVWINLEYLTAEAFAARSHGLPSPVMSGPGKGCTKRFHYPGFTADTGGLLREPGLPDRQRTFNRTSWLGNQGVNWQGENLVSLFCYEPPALRWLLQALAGAPSASLMLVTHGRAASAVATACANLGWPPGGAGNLRLHRLPALTQTDYDHLLWACDLNCVRGEDSLVRALWARKPFVWQIYPQDDGAHIAKLNAFLDWADAPGEVRRFHAVWNAAPTALPPIIPSHSPSFTHQPSRTLATTPATRSSTDTPCSVLAGTLPESLPNWSDAAPWARHVADRLWTQPDLVTQLLAALPAEHDANSEPPVPNPGERR